MNQTHRRECFGTMFPDILHIRSGQPHRGKVFSYLLGQAGGLWRSNREATGDIEQWDDCEKCPEFDNCYKFCMGKLLLASAIKTE